MDTALHNPGNDQVPLSLSRLVKNLVNNFQPLAFQHHSRIVNEAEKDLLSGSGAMN